MIDPWVVTRSDAYTPPQAMTERVKYRNPTVVYPFSNRSSASANVDIDHTTSWPTGATTQSNFGPLDRTSHRAATHGGFRKNQISPGIYHWHTPAGQQFWVTPHGTYAHNPLTTTRVTGYTTTHWHHPWTPNQSEEPPPF